MAESSNNSNDDDIGGVLLLGVLGICFLVLIGLLIYIVKSRYDKRRTTTGGEFGGGDYSNYENMSDSQLARAETDTANNFYNWNQSQLTPLVGDNAPGGGSTKLPINAPHLVAMIAAAITLDPGTIGAELKLIKTIAVRVGRLAKCRATTLCAKLTLKLGEKILTRLGIKAAARALTAASTKVATAMATRLGVAASTGPAAPIVLIAEFVFQATLGMLDQFGVGGYTDIVPSSVYEGMRDEYDRAFKEATVAEGYEWPVIAGPGDKLSQTEWEKKISDGYDVIFNDTNHPATALFLQLYQVKRRQVNRDLTDAECETLLQTQGLGKSIEDAVMGWVSAQLGGKSVKLPSGNVYCSYSSSAAVDASFHWPLTSEYEKDIYSEWDEQYQVAYARQSAMRTFAEQLGNGCTYNKQTRVPNITEAFCRSNGLDYSNGQCKYAEGQEIAEMIFGKTFIRGLTQVFDPAQYESCSDKQMCKGTDKCIDDGYFCRINRMAYPRQPSDMQCKSGYQKSSPGFCKKECPTDSNGKWKMYGGLCYHPKVNTNLLSKVPTYGDCPTGEGWRTEPVTCFQDLVCHTGTSSCATTSWGCKRWGKLTSLSLFNDHCESWGDICYPGVTTDCNGGPKSQARPKTCPEGYRDNGAGMCEAVSQPFDATVYSVGDKGECPTGKEREGLLCYDPCPSNYTKVTGGLWCTPNDGFKVKIEAKKRKIPFSTPDFAGSPVGQRIQQIKEAGQSGDVGRLGAGLGCLFLASSPVVNGIGLQDFANMIPDPKTGQGVQQQ